MNVSASYYHTLGFPPPFFFSFFHSSVRTYNCLFQFPCHYSEFLCKSWFNISSWNSTGWTEKGSSLTSKFQFLNLSYISPFSNSTISTNSTNVTSSFCRLRTLITSKKKELSKMLIFLSLTFHFKDLKININ